MLTLFFFMAIVLYVIGYAEDIDGLCWISVMVAALGLYFFVMLI